MLSQHDRRALAEIENQLRDSDPAFVRRLEHPAEYAPGRAGRRQTHRRIILVGLIAGVMLLAAAFATKSADAVVWGVVVLISAVGAATALAAARFRHRRD